MKKHIFTFLIIFMLCVSVGCESNSAETYLKAETTSISSENTSSTQVDKTVTSTQLNESTTEKSTILIQNSSSNSFKKKNTTTIVDIDPNLLIEFGSINDMINKCSKFKTKTDVLKLANINRSTENFDYFYNLLNEADMLFKDKFFVTMYSEKYQITKIYLNLRYNYFYYSFQSKNKENSIDLLFYAYEKYEKPKEVFMKFDNGIDVFLYQRVNAQGILEDENYMFFIEQYPAVLYSNDENIDRDFFENLIIKKIDI